MAKFSRRGWVVEWDSSGLNGGRLSLIRWNMHERFNITLSGGSDSSSIQV